MSQHSFSLRRARRAAAVLLVLAAGACSGDAPQDLPAADAPGAAGGARLAEVPRVLVAAVEKRPMVRYLETTTRVESEREIEIHAEVSGFVTALLAEEGDVVEAGRVLCELDREDEELAKRDAEVALREAQDALAEPALDRAEAKAQIESARLAWQQAERDFQRDQRLSEGTLVASAVSKQALEESRLAMETAAAEHERARIALDKVDVAEQKARTAVQRAEVQLAQAERALAQRYVTAPFAGQIATRSVRPGQSVGPADPLFVLTDVDHVRAVFYRAQEELSLFRPRAEGEDGLALEARTEALPGAVFPGRVRRISPTIDRESGQFRVTAEFDAPEPGGPKLLPGMLVRLSIATDRHADALVVPKRAVRREGDAAHVLVIDADERVRKVPVREGYEDRNDVEVIAIEAGALTAGNFVVAVGSRDLEDGDRVAVERPARAPEAGGAPAVAGGEGAPAAAGG